MNFDTITDRQLGEVEQTARNLLEALRRGKFNQESVFREVLLLEEAAQKERQKRFDLTDQPHKGY